MISGEMVLFNASADDCAHRFSCCVQYSTEIAGLNLQGPYMFEAVSCGFKQISRRIKAVSMQP